MAAPMKKLIVGCSSKIFSHYRACRSSYWLRNVATNTSSVQLEADQKVEPYLLYSGLILERRPVITPQLGELEKKYKELQSTVEIELSQLSKHERRHRDDLALAKRRLDPVFDESSVEGNTLTATDLEDMWSDESAKFTPAPRITDADQSGNMMTSKRKLDKTLYLLVKQKFDEADTDGLWVFPQAVIGDEESTKQACQRVATDIYPTIDIRFTGNAPCSYYKIKYPKRFITTEFLYVGAKVFFHMAELSSGDITKVSELIQNSISEFCWVTAEEAQQFLQKDYWRQIEPVLHDN